jgi:AraC family transcriptional regulator, positive regulator of tynA and feaB
MNTGFVTFSTRGVAAPRKVQLWNERASDLITLLRVEPSRGIDFEASLQAAEVGGIGLIEAASTPTRVVHTRSAESCAEAAAYLIHLQLHGTCVNRQASREVLLGPGDFVLCDNTLPCELLLGGDNLMLVLRIPQPLFKRRLPTPEVYVNRHMSADRSGGLLATRFASLLWEQCRRGVSPVIADRLADSVCDLLAAAFMESGCAPLDGSAVQRLWKLRLRRFVDSRLSDPNLTPTQIARHFKISPRYVHKLYAREEESVSKYVLRRRLEECHRAIGDRAQAAKSISTIAFEWGFNNTTHFARVFRERFGRSPSERRREAFAGSR